MVDARIIEDEVKLLRQKGFDFKAVDSGRIIRGEILGVPIEFILPADYPDRPPIVRTPSRIRHEIFEGRIARKLETLQKWRPTFNLYMIANEIKAKFIEKSPKDIIKIANKDLKIKEGKVVSNVLVLREKPIFFGKGKWYDELGDIIVKLFAEKSKEFGGLIPLTDIFVELVALSNFKITVNDVMEAIRRKIKQGALAGLIRSDSGGVLVQFYPPELSNDAFEVVKILADNDGKLTLQELLTITGWSISRLEQTLRSLEKRRIIVIDRESMYGIVIYLPTLRGK